MKSEDKIMEQGIIKAVCISPAKGTEKQNVHHAHVIENWGLENDAHAGTPSDTASTATGR